MKIEYNSPVVLTFSLIAVAVYLGGILLSPQWVQRFFMVMPTMSLGNPLDYFRLFSHVLGHSSWPHLFGNIIYILLLGPLLEEKYGSASLLLMIAITALSTGVLNVLFFSSALLGASGIVFMLIILASIVDFRQGTVPLTFILVAAIFIGTEVARASSDDNVSQTAHIAGGAIGAVFGFGLRRGSNSSSRKRG